MEMKYDLEERTYDFAKMVALYCRELPRSIPNMEYSRQVIRSSASVGANYIEANESLSRNDCAMRMKICRKEAKESMYWLRLIIDTNPDEFGDRGRYLHNEATELKNIFCSIIEKFR
jgi:four helix bundle protein